MATPFDAEYKQVQRKAKASTKHFTVLHESAIIENIDITINPVLVKKVTGGQYIGPHTNRHNMTKAAKKYLRKHQTKLKLNIMG